MPSAKRFAVPPCTTSRSIARTASAIAGASTVCAGTLAWSKRVS
jgi:hypothetical protein